MKNLKPCKVNKVCRWLLVICCLTQQAHAQDIHFSQFYETPLLRNPALAGIFTGDYRFSSVYRTQWATVTTPYQTGSFNGEFKLPTGKGNDFLTLAGEIYYDKAGSIGLQTV